MNQLLKVLGVIAKTYLGFSVFHIIYKIIKYYISCKRADALWERVPGEKIDFLATQYIANSKTLPDWVTSKMKEHPNKPLLKIAMPLPVLLANNAESIKWVLKEEFLINTKPKELDGIFELMNEFLGSDGIFVLRHGHKYPKDHAMWEKERKITSKIFTKNNMKTVFYDTFIEKSKHVIKKLEKYDGKEFDIQELFFSFTMDSIEKFFMGTEVNTIEGGMSPYGKAFDRAHYYMMNYAYSSVYLETFVRLLTPYPFGPWTASGTGLVSPMGKFLGSFKSSWHKFYQSIKQLDDHIYKYIRLKRSDPDIKQKKDIIANFLNSGAELTDKEIHDIVLNLTIAGRDTTACTLSWMIYELTQNKNVQQKLIEEIDFKLKGKSPTFDDLNTENMPYLNGVVFETLRLHPAVPVNEKVTTRDVQYYDGTIIPEGTIMLYSPYALGRNENIYQNAGEFDPDRWIPFKQPDQYEFPVFQAGPRFCLGKDMAQFEMKLLMCIMLQKFKFTMDEKEAKKVSYSLMLTLSIVNDEEKSSHKLLVKPISR